MQLRAQPRRRGRRRRLPSLRPSAVTVSSVLPCPVQQLSASLFLPRNQVVDSGEREARRRRLDELVTWAKLTLRLRKRDVDA